MSDLGIVKIKPSRQSVSVIYCNAPMSDELYNLLGEFPYEISSRGSEC